MIFLTLANFNIVGVSASPYICVEESLLGDCGCGHTVIKEVLLSVLIKIV